MTIILLLAGLSLEGGGRMPVEQQNAMVQKFCAVCHNDVSRVGGLTLSGFDAGHSDPSLAAMLASKLKDGAMGAAGVKPMPDRATEDAFRSALAEEGAGATEWFVKRTATVLSASILQILPSAKSEDLYRLTLTCREDTHEGTVQVAWAPGDVPETGATLSAAVDGGTPRKYPVQNQDGFAKLEMQLPVETLRIDHVLSDKTVTFPFSGLPRAARQGLSVCFTAGVAAR